MQLDIWTALEGIGGAATAIATAYAAIHKLGANSKKKKEQYRQAILDQANADMDKIKAELEEKIKNLEIELASQKENVSRDFGHMREIYSAEIKVLSGKIDDLRENLAEQHANMVALLTKLVQSR